MTDAEAIRTAFPAPLHLDPPSDCPFCESAPCKCEEERGGYIVGACAVAQFAPVRPFDFTAVDALLAECRERRLRIEARERFLYA